MRIQRLELKNYRGFSDLQVDFPAKGTAVFIGWNGAGKSSVLEAISYLLRTIYHESFGIPHRYNNIPDLDVKVGSNLGSIKLFFENDNKTEWVHIGKYSIGNQVKRFSSDLLYEGLQKEQNDVLYKKTFPIYGFYKTRRKLEEKIEEESPKRYLIPQQKAYEGAWGGNLQFDHFIKWFVEEENKENREKIRLKDFEYKHPALNAVRKAWQSFFAAIGESQYENLRVEEREFNQFTSAPSSLVITKDGEDLNLQQLSDGERLSLSMVADIAHRLVLANPALDTPLQGNGIVLIDEIELHLHPAWQRRIVPALEQTFPNIQFIMTTHSPQVLSEVGHENVFILEHFQLVDRTPYTPGRDSNTLLQDIFEVSERPESACSTFSKFYRIMDDPKRQEEAKSLLQEMTAKYGEDDPDIQKARLHYEFMYEA